MNDFSQLSAENPEHRLAQISPEELAEQREETMHAKLCDWLSGLNCHDVKPVNVRIGDEEWVGCYYKRTLEYKAGMDAVTRGEKKEGDTYTQESIYCLGKLPKAKLRRGKPNPNAGVCFPFEGKDWYVASYMPKENMNEGNASFHPFGISFILAPWDIPNSKIDQYERKPYTREELRVSYI